jgi:hypothetical protein
VAFGPRTREETNRAEELLVGEWAMRLSHFMSILRRNDIYICMYIYIYMYVYIYVYCIHIYIYITYIYIDVVHYTFTCIYTHCIYIYIYGRGQRFCKIYWYIQES